MTAAGAIHSMGEFIVHPKGFHHYGKGVPGEAFRFAEEVDAISSGAVAIDEAAFELVGREKAVGGALGAISLCLTLRRRGGRILSAGEVTVVDESSPNPTLAEAQAFAAKFGFEWNAPDLERVRELHRGTGMCWNPRWWGGDIRYTKYESRPALHWKSYAEVPSYRARADAIVTFIAGHIPLAPGSAGGSNGDSRGMRNNPPAEPGAKGAERNEKTPQSSRVLDFGCGDGLFSHLFARQGIEVTGIDVEPGALDQARAMTSHQSYPHARPRFLDARALDARTGSTQFDAVVMLDVIEHLANPVAHLRRVRDWLVPQGILAVVTPEWQFGGSSDPVFHVVEYTLEQLVNQVRACGFQIVQTGRIGAPYRDIIVIARRA